MRAVGYGRVSTVEQAEGLSLDGQRARLVAECEHRGIELVEFRGEQVSTRKPIARRPQLARTLAELRDGTFDVLMVARLDRLARSSLEFQTVLERTEHEPWQLVMLDPSVDTTTPYGRAMAGMASIFAQLERDLISQRTKEEIAERKRNGTYSNNAPEVDGAVVEKIMAVRGRMPSERIATFLDELGLVPPRGEHWSGRTVRKVIAREEGRLAS